MNLIGERDVDEIVGTSDVIEVKHMKFEQRRFRGRGESERRGRT